MSPAAKQKLRRMLAAKEFAAREVIARIEESLAFEEKMVALYGSLDDWVGSVEGREKIRVWKAALGGARRAIR